MKLILIITDYGSFNNFLSELAVKISEDVSFELIVICSQKKIIEISDKKIYDNKIKFYFIDIPRRISIVKEFRAAKSIRAIVDREKPELIHSHFTTATFPVLLLKKTTVPYWATIHGLGMNSTFGIKKILFTVVEMFCFWRLNKIYTMNEQDTLLLKKYFPSKVNKHQCLGVGCDIIKFDYNNIPEIAKNEIVEKYDFKPNHIIISFTGRFVNFKGFDLVIKAFKILNDHYSDKFKLVLMGGQDPIHKTGLNETETYFFQNNKNIINIGFTSNVEHYLSLTDIFLFPSKKEGIPTCILEALSMGVPVITFNARGNNDIIKNKYNGLLIEPNNDPENEVEKIIEAILWMRDNKNSYDYLKSNALKDRNLYSRDRFVDEQINQYNDFRKNGSEG